MKHLPLVLVFGLAACTTSEDASSTLTKEEARQLAGKADGIDICELNGWYGDGVCDEFCPEVDFDCEYGPTEDFFLSGDGFVFADNATIHASFSQGAGFVKPKSALISDGGFEMTFEGQWSQYSYGAFLHIWVDYDSDGLCGAGDYVSSSFVSPAGFHHIEGGSLSVGTNEWRIYCDEFANNSPEIANPNFDCEALCAPRTGGCFHASTCEEFCQDSVRYKSSLVQDAFTACVESDPMCYIDGYGCTVGMIDCITGCENDGGTRDDCVESCENPIWN